MMVFLLCGVGHLWVRKTRRERKAGGEKEKQGLTTVRTTTYMMDNCLRHCRSIITLKNRHVASLESMSRYEGKVLIMR